MPTARNVMHLQKTHYGLLLILLLVGPLALAGCARTTDNTQAPPQEAATQQQENTEATADPDVPYVPTPQPVVERMLEMAEVTKSDTVYDLGSGDGRIVITAAQKYGARGVGIDIDPQRIKEARQNAKEAGVTDLVEFRQQDLFETDVSNATAVTLYLLPSVNLKLRPKLLNELEPGTPVVSHDFDMGDWEPEQTVEMGNDTIYRWTIPEEVPAQLQQGQADQE